MESDPNTSVYKGPPEEINLDEDWFYSFMAMDVDYYKQPTIPSIFQGVARFVKNEKHDYLMSFLEKKGR